MSAIVVDEPTARPVPMVVAVPHAGTRLPHEVRTRLRVDRQAIRRLEDPWVDRLVASAPAIGAWRLRTAWARAVADVNRAPDEFAGHSAVDGFRDTPKARVGLGVVPTVLGRAPLYVPPLSEAEVRARVALAHTPYHAALKSLLQRVVAGFGRVLLLDTHSMPNAAWPQQTPVADVVLGDGFGQAAAAATVAAVEAAFVRQGFSTVRNRPYAGGFVTQHYGAPARGVEVVQIELRRGLYMDEATFRPNRCAPVTRERLETVLLDIASGLATNRDLPISLAGE